MQVFVGIEWLPLASPELLRDARQLAGDLGTGIHVHLNESLGEVENSRARFGRRPTEVAYDAGLLGPDCVAAHCVWLTDHEIGLMRETGTHISHNPSSNAKLGNGVARLPEMLAAGLNVGLGHDAAESSNSCDLFDVMKFASLIHRAHRGDASLLQAPDVVRMATRNGAAALGHETGELSAGKKADVILVDTRSAMFTPHAAGRPGPAVLAPGVRGGRQRGGHHDRGRADPHARAGTAHRGRGGRAGPGQPGPAAHRRGHRLHELTFAATTRENAAMSRIIITGGTVLTINDADDVHFGGHVVLDGDRIAAVGEGPYPGAPADGDQVIDASGKIVMPGLVDLHYHTAIAKGFSDHLPLWEYLEACWYPFIRTLDADAAYWSAAASYLESIKCGVTTVNDMYRRLPDLGRAAHDIGIRAVLSNDVALPEHNLDTLQDNQDAYAAVHGLGGGRIEVYVGIEWLPLASPELLRDARALADELGTGIHIHLNESLTEVENSRERFGRRPTEVAYDAGLLGPDCVAAHCVWLTDTEIALMRETHTQISHNPSSNAKLGNGIARLPEMLAAGINVGLGHDAAECNNSRDAFEVMKFASLMHRAQRVDASLMQAPAVLRMATRNGSAALRHDTGQLIPGHKADVILVDTANPMFTPLMPGDKAHIYSHLVFSANGSAVDTTIVDGQILMRGRELLTMDEQQILSGANEGFLRTLEKIRS